MGLRQQVDRLLLCVQMVWLDDVELDKVTDVVMANKDVPGATSNGRGDCKIDSRYIIFANEGRMRLLGKTEVSKKASEGNDEFTNLAEDDVLSLHGTNTDTVALSVSTCKEWSRVLSDR